MGALRLAPSQTEMAIDEWRQSLDRSRERAQSARELFEDGVVDVAPVVEVVRRSLDAAAIAQGDIKRSLQIHQLADSTLKKSAAGTPLDATSMASDLSWLLKRNWQIVWQPVRDIFDV